MSLYRIHILPMALALAVGACGQGEAQGGGDGSAMAGDAASGDERREQRRSAAEQLARRRPRKRRPPPVNTTPPPKLLSASHLLIGYEGAKGAKNSKATRSRAEARQLAEELLKAAQGDQRFSDLVRERSESPDKRAAGYLGVFPPGERFPEVAEALQKVAFEELVPRVIETPFGFHVVRREKTVHVGHILIMHNESRFAHKGISRDRDAARAEAERLHKILGQKDADRAAIAREHSDCHRSKAIGGDLGTYGRGMKTLRGGRLLPAMIRAIQRIESGESSDVTETQYGFHIIWLYLEEAVGSGVDAGGGEA